MNSKPSKCEFGSTFNVNFPKHEYAKICDDSGNALPYPVCECGEFKSLVYGAYDSVFICLSCSEKGSK